MESTEFMEVGEPQRAADRLSGVSTLAAESRAFQRSEFVQAYSSGTQELADLLRRIEVCAGRALY